MRQSFLVLAMLVFGCATAAEAAPVIEFELDGTASNNSFATAQTIPTSAFTLPVPPTVFDPPGDPTAALTGFGGGSDVDIFRISGPSCSSGTAQECCSTLVRTGRTIPVPYTPTTL